MPGILNPLLPSTNQNEGGDKMRQKKLVFFVMLFATVLSFAVAPSTSSAAPVLATAEGEQPGVRAEVTELKRASGGTINLKFVIVNESDGSFDSRSRLMGEEYASVDGITLIDPVGKKKYFVVRDTEKHCVCSRNVNNVGKKSRSNLWAKFPAPPEDVQKISVTIPHFQPMDDVPISR
jgi:hypothetical protein